MLEVYEGSLAAGVEDEASRFRIGVPKRGDANAPIAEDIIVVAIRQAHPDVITA